MPINPLDPMVGFYDRLLAEGDQKKITMLRNMHFMFQGYGEEARQKIREHAIENGFGTEETMLKLFPHFEEV